MIMINLNVNNKYHKLWDCLDLIFRQIKLYYSYSFDNLQHDNVVPMSRVQQHFEFKNDLMSDTKFLKPHATEINIK